MQDALRAQKRTDERGSRARSLPTKEETQRELKRLSNPGGTPEESQETDTGTTLTWKEALAAARMVGTNGQEAASRPLTDTFG